MAKLRAMMTICLLVGVLYAGNAAAQDVDASVVTGNTYTCYFLSTIDIFNTDITFDEKGAMLFSNFDGDGFYFTVANAFVGAYWALNAKIGARTDDALFLMIGSSFDPFVLGTGILIMDYSDVFFMVYFGFRNIEE